MRRVDAEHYRLTRHVHTEREGSRREEDAEVAITEEYLNRASLGRRHTIVMEANAALEQL